MEVKHADNTSKGDVHIFLFEQTTDIKSEYINKEIKEKLKKIEIEKPLILFDGTKMDIFVLSGRSDNPKDIEQNRKNAASITKDIQNNNLKEVIIFDFCKSSIPAKAFCEGFILSQYKFTKYKTKEKNQNELNLSLTSKNFKTSDLKELNILLEAVIKARDLVNEPNSYLTAEKLSEEFKLMGKESGFEVEVWNESKIQAQKMGGLLAVNSGSSTPATFNIMEWKPKKTTNSKPIILVGKGVVFDTGGMSLKPTANSMDYMKCDMAGSACVAGIMYVIAKSKLPLYVVGLVPATDNRPGEEAIVPGDVITMYNGNTVEVKNTDAEGRLILADSLHYAKKLDPELVIDFATLTGAAARAIGSYASAIMGTASDEVFDTIERKGLETYERVIRFPLWDEYGEELESEIADFSNLGRGEGGQISAGKFLEKFTDYPWVHIDIAGTAFIHKSSDYKPYGGTGVGVRLIYEYLKTLIKK